MNTDRPAAWLPGSSRTMWVVFAAVAAIVMLTGVMLTGGGRVHATNPPTVPPNEGEPGAEVPTTTAPPPPSVPPLVPVPTGCDPIAQPHVVFIGTVIDGDYRTKRFQIEQLRAGAPAPFPAPNDQIDIRYGQQEQYLKAGETYLVGAGVHPDLGILYSTVTPPVEDFGGDEVIGVSDTDVECLEVESGIRTLYPDGSEVEAKILSPLQDNWLRVAVAFGQPLLISIGVVFALALLGRISRAAFGMVAAQDD